jgi:hypothetical protein
MPTAGQWKIACASMLAAAGVGFAIGRMSASASAPSSRAAAASAACAESTPRLPDPVPPPTTVARVVEKPPTIAPEQATAPIENAVPGGTDAADQAAAEKAIAKALGRGARRAATCRNATSPSGTAHVTVTFLPSGEVKTAVIRGAPFAGTSEGECVVGKFRPLRVPPFTGDAVTVRRDVTFD